MQHTSISRGWKITPSISVFIPGRLFLNFPRLAGFHFHWLQPVLKVPLVGSEQGKCSASPHLKQVQCISSPNDFCAFAKYHWRGKICSQMYPSKINFAFFNVVATPPPCNSSPGLKPLEINGNFTVFPSEIFYQGKRGSLTTDQFS